MTLKPKQIFSSSEKIPVQSQQVTPGVISWFSSISSPLNRTWKSISSEKISSWTNESQKERKILSRLHFHEHTASRPISRLSRENLGAAHLHLLLAPKVIVKIRCKYFFFISALSQTHSCSRSYHKSAGKFEKLFFPHKKKEKKKKISKSAKWISFWVNFPELYVTEKFRVSHFVKFLV